MIHRDLTRFLEILEVDDTTPYWLALKDEDRKSLSIISFSFSALSTLPITHISLAPTISTTKRGYWSSDIALWTKILCVLDVDTKDTKDIQSLLDFFSSKALTTTIAVETRKGWHFLWLTKEKLQIHHKDKEEYIPTENFQKWQEFSLILRTYINTALKQKFPFVDKIFNFNYTRLPSPGLKFIVNDIWYTLDELQDKLVKAFNIFLKRDEETNNLAVPTETLPFGISKNAIFIAKEGCTILRYLDENTATHTHREWCHWTLIYSNAYLVAKNDFEKEQIREEFHAKARLYPSYDYKQNEDLFQRSIKKGFIPIRCETLRSNYGSTYCKDCELYKEPLLAYSPFLWRRTEFVIDVDEVVKGLRFKVQGSRLENEKTVKVYVEGEDYVVEEVIYKKNSPTYKYRKLCRVIEIEHIFTFDETKANYVIARSKNLQGKEVYFVGTSLVDNKDKTAFLRQLINKNLLVEQITAQDRKILLRLWDYLVGEFKEKFSNTDPNDPTSAVFSLADVESGVYNPFILNFKPLNPLVLKVLAENNKLPQLIFNTAGNHEEYFRKFSELLKIDIYLKYIVGITLVQYFVAHPDAPQFHENPVILITGDPGDGKSMRSNIALSLWGAGSFDPLARAESGAQGSLLTDAYLSYVAPRMAIPWLLDDIDADGQKDNLFNRVKALANAKFSAIRKTANQDYIFIPLKRVVIATVETKAKTFTLTLFQEGAGAGRRVLVLTLPPRAVQALECLGDTNSDYLFQKIAKFLEYTRENYGHVGHFYRWWYKNKDESIEMQLIRELDGYDIDYQQKKLIARIVWMTYEFIRFLNEKYNAGIENNLKKIFDQFLRLLLGLPSKENIGLEERIIEDTKKNFFQILRALKDKDEIYSYRSIKNVLVGHEISHELVKILASTIRNKGHQGVYKFSYYFSREVPTIDLLLKASRSLQDIALYSIHRKAFDRLLQNISYLEKEEEEKGKGLIAELVKFGIIKDKAEFRNFVLKLYIDIIHEKVPIVLELIEELVADLVKQGEELRDVLDYTSILRTDKPYDLSEKTKKKHKVNDELEEVLASDDDIDDIPF